MKECTALVETRRHVLANNKFSNYRNFKWVAIDGRCHIHLWGHLKYFVVPFLASPWGLIIAQLLRTIKSVRFLVERHTLCMGFRLSKLWTKTVKNVHEKGSTFESAFIKLKTDTFKRWENILGGENNLRRFQPKLKMET